MAEFCLECWNMLNDTKYTERELVLSHFPDLCEGCGQYKKVVVRERRLKFLYDIRKK
ncbi:MAG: hypothetical protein ACI4PV_06070 [Butyricicoccus sp.]